jgi:GNAT superfamily N-acetyltransferase
MISTSTVRPASADDRGAALDTLVSAFADDPLARHLFGDRPTLDRHLPYFLGYLFDVSLDGCEVMVTDDLSAASLWTPPGGNRLGAETVAERWQEVLLPSLPAVFEVRYAQFGALIVSTLPKQPHWHLGVLGVRRDLQRRGLGSAVCAPMLRRADREHVPVLLETATRANLPFYERLRFHVRSRVDLPDGPPVWTMWREPEGVA